MKFGWSTYILTENHHISRISLLLLRKNRNSWRPPVKSIGKLPATNVFKISSNDLNSMESASSPMFLQPNRGMSQLINSFLWHFSPTSAVSRLKLRLNKVISISHKQLASYRTPPPPPKKKAFTSWNTQTHHSLRKAALVKKSIQNVGVAQVFVGKPRLPCAFEDSWGSEPQLLI